MIQRIQSVYLFLAGLIPAFTFTTPLARFQDTKGEGFLTLSALNLQAANMGLPNVQPTYLLMAILSALLIALAAFNIFQYKNRRRQIRITGWSVALVVAWYIAYIAVSTIIAGELSLSFKPALCAALPFASLVFTLLARRAIQKDEELVRAADRIR